MLFGMQCLFVEGVDVVFDRLDDYRSNVLKLRLYGERNTKYDLSLHIPDEKIVEFLKDLRDSIDNILKEIQDVDVIE